MASVVKRLAHDGVAKMPIQYAVSSEKLKTTSPAKIAYQYNNFSPYQLHNL